MFRLLLLYLLFFMFAASSCRWFRIPPEQGKASGVVRSHLASRDRIELCLPKHRPQTSVVPRGHEKCRALADAFTKCYLYHSSISFIELPGLYRILFFVVVTSIAWNCPHCVSNVKCSASSYYICKEKSECT